MIGRTDGYQISGFFVTEVGLDSNVAVRLFNVVHAIFSQWDTIKFVISSHCEHTDRCTDRWAH